MAKAQQQLDTAALGVSVAVRRRCVDQTNRRLGGEPLPLIRRATATGLVDGDAPEPRLKRAAPREGSAVTQRPDERVVNGLLGELLVMQDRDRDPQELSVAAPIDSLDCRTRIAFRDHPPS